MKQKAIVQRNKNTLLDRIRVVTQILFLAAPFLLFVMIKMNPEFNGMGIDVVIETYPVILITTLRLCCLPFIAFIIYKMDFYTKTADNDWYVIVSLFLHVISLLLLNQIYFTALIVALIFAFSNKVSFKFEDFKKIDKTALLKKCAPSLVMALFSVLVFIISKRVGL